MLSQKLDLKSRFAIKDTRGSFCYVSDAKQGILNIAERAVIDTWLSLLDEEPRLWEPTWEHPPRLSEDREGSSRITNLTYLISPV
jgi:hypothetical protein